VGADKEATDIWKFGRARPDLSLDETLAAPMPTLTAEEMAERQRLVNKRYEPWLSGEALSPK
jgi:hypothetical protein